MGLTIALQNVMHAKDSATNAATSRSGTAGLWPATLLLACLASGAACADKLSLGYSTRDAVDALVTQSIARWRNPGGYVLAIVVDSHLDYLQAYGSAAPDRAMAVDAVFPIASVTKTFTGTIAAKLASDGRLDLDADIRKNLPEGVGLHPSFDSSRITMRILLTHRSGWPKDHVNRQDLDLGLPDGFDPSIGHPASYTPSAIYRGIYETPPEVPPLSRHTYSNLGVHLAGHVIELHIGKPLEVLMRDELFLPLGLVDTSFARDQNREARVPQGFAYDENHHRYYALPAWVAGEVAGGMGLSSTARDLARYASCLMRSDCTRNVIGESGERNLFANYVEYVRHTETHYFQALGWRASQFGPYGVIFRHNGDADGHHAFLAMSRDRRLAVVLLATGSHRAMEELGNDILLHVLQDPDVKAPSPAAPTSN